MKGAWTRANIRILACRSKTKKHRYRANNGPATNSWYAAKHQTLAKHHWNTDTSGIECNHNRLWLPSSFEYPKHRNVTSLLTARKTNRKLSALLQSHTASYQYLKMCSKCQLIKLSFLIQRWAVKSSRPNSRPHSSKSVRCSQIVASRLELRR